VLEIVHFVGDFNGERRVSLWRSHVEEELRYYEAGVKIGVEYVTGTRSSFYLRL
jgi:hypothetical protein